MASTKNHLLKLFQQLGEQDRQSLLDFAEFLQQKRDQKKTDEPLQQPLELARPSEENVIAAIKRLKKSYFMLNTDSLLNETSALLAQFMVQGRTADEVIDDLHSLFEQQYEKYLNHD